MQGQPVTVLVVDDLAPFRRAATAVIGATDGFVLAGEADSGEAALLHLEQRRVGLVLMDVDMPGMGGIRAAEEIRRRFPDVRVVLLSVHVAADLEPELTSGGNHFCHKGCFGPGALEELWARNPL